MGSMGLSIGKQVYTVIMTLVIIQIGGLATHYGIHNGVQNGFYRDCQVD